MKIKFETTINKAHKEAARLLREKLGVKRLPNYGFYWQDLVAVKCDCGQTLARQLYTVNESVTVGICETCGKK